MSNAEILIKLRDLHADLAGLSEELDTGDVANEATVEALGQLVTDIGSLVDRAKQLTADDDPTEDRERIMNRIREFQTEHPDVTRFLSQVTDVLAMIGL